MATFGLIAIFGLFSVGMNTSKQADTATLLAALSLQVTDQLRGGTNSTLNISTNFYFDKQGSATNLAAAYYQCLLSTTTTNSRPLGNLSNNFVSAKLAFSWPVPIPSANRTTTNIFSSAPYRP